ncbi:peptide ABC transporter substrate-binding protein, partial [Pyxidicoccus fallax]|nr:peptide ABC transporter substrate-binding protein [Pyxidicoccus fallax]
VTLLYDSSVEDQRAVAERIQVKLHDRGYTVALEPLPRAALRARWAKGDFELMLHALLLPPAPGPALAVVLDAGGRRDLLGVELPAIGALADMAARDARARERALALAQAVPLVPLYAQGLAVRVAPEVGGLKFDAQGLPQLDGLHLVPPEGAALGARP